MNKFLWVSAALALAGTALWGWGWLVRRGARTGPWPIMLTVAVGLAAVLGLGGILNLAHLVHRPVLDAVLVLGLGLALAGAWQARQRSAFSVSRKTLVAAAPILVTGVLLAGYLLPQAAFNVYDDFEKYLAHPLEMLALGTSAQNPLDTLGAETLGGQAFLQTFVAAHFPLAYVGAVDGVFCLLLAVALAGLGWRPGRWAAGALAAELCVLVINPQIVNVSSLFSGVCLIMTAVLLTAQPAAPGAGAPSAPVLGLVYAGLLSLKGTLAIFVGVHWLSLLGIGLVLGRPRWRWLTGVGGWTLLFVAPWLLLHAPLYLPPLLAAPLLPPGRTATPVDFFSTTTLFWGATPLDYTVLALAGLLTAGALVLAARRGWLPARSPCWRRPRPGCRPCWPTS